MPDSSQNNEVGLISNENNCPTLKIDEKEDLRKKLEEKSKKYQHLPVYDKEEERRKNQKLEKKMTKIFSDVDKQLGTVTNLTSSHMENKGIKLVPTPFDESERRASDSPSAQSGAPDNKRSADKNQGDSEKPKLSEPNETHNVPPPYKRTPSQDKPNETYESLGQTFRDLTDKMESVTRDLQGHETEIPFVDEGSDEDYTQKVRVANDPDTAMDLALSELLTSLSVDQNLVVEAIQLEEPQEPGPVISSTVLMVTERKVQGSDTIHLSRKTIRREYTDV